MQINPPNPLKAIGAGALSVMLFMAMGFQRENPQIPPPLRTVAITLPDGGTCHADGRSDVKELRVEEVKSYRGKVPQIAWTASLVTADKKIGKYPMLAMPRFDGRPASAIFREEEDGTTRITSILMDHVYKDGTSKLSLWEGCDRPYGALLHKNSMYHVFMVLQDGTKTLGFHVYVTPGKLYLMG